MVDAGVHRKTSLTDKVTDFLKKHSDVDHHTKDVHDNIQGHFDDAKKGLDKHTDVINDAKSKVKQFSERCHDEPWGEEASKLKDVAQNIQDQFK